MKTIGYATHSKDSLLEPFNFERRNLRSNDVAIEISMLYLDVLGQGALHAVTFTTALDWTLELSCDLLSISSASLSFLIVDFEWHVEVDFMLLHCVFNLGKGFS